MRSLSALLSLIDSGCRGFDKPLSQVLPRGLDYFYQDPAKKATVPREANIVMSESSGPELILDMLARRMNAPPSAAPRAA
jgi:hypothetical protein